VVPVELLLKVVSVLVGDALEPRDLHVVRTSRVESFAFFRSRESEGSARAVLGFLGSTSLTEVRAVALEVVLAGRLLPLERLLLDLLAVLVLGVIDLVVIDV
jgi:hypothetical protein